MNIFEIILIVTLIVIGILQPLYFGLYFSLYNKKNKLLKDRLESTNNLYLPVLVILQNYYCDKEDYEAAKTCKDLIEAVQESDKIFEDEKTN